MFSYSREAMASASPGAMQTTFTTKQEENNSQSSSLLLPSPEDQKPFQCGFCSVMFDINIELVTHINEHSLTKPFQCGYCKVSYDTNPELTGHVETHQVFFRVALSRATKLTQPHAVDNQRQNTRSESCSRTETEGSAGVHPPCYGFRNCQLTQKTTADAGMQKTQRALGSDGKRVKLDVENEDGEETASSDVQSDSEADLVVSFPPLRDCPSSDQSQRPDLGSGEMPLLAEEIEGMPGTNSTRNQSSHAVQTLVSREHKVKVEVNADGAANLMGKLKVDPAMAGTHCDGQDKNVFVCGTCSAGFTAPRYLSDHWREIHSICSVCGESFVTPKVQQAHQKSVHEQDAGKVRPFMCGICSKAFQTVLSVKAHIKKAHIKYAHRKQFTQLRKITDPVRFPHKCQKEELKVSTKSDFDSRPFHCPDCPARFKQRGHLNDHMNSLHSSEKPHQCPICGEKFKLKGYLRSHSRRYHKDLIQKPSPEVEPYKCLACGDVFKSQSSLVKHSVSEHSDDRPFPCPRCPSRFKQRIHMSDHVNSVHSSERPHACSICGETFKLKLHLRQHTVCKHSDVLPAPSAQSDSEQRHHRGDASSQSQEEESCAKNPSAHYSYTETGRLLLSPKVTASTSKSETKSTFVMCSVCGKLVSSKKFKNHLVTHTDKRPHKCEMCNKAFKLKKTLKVHARTHSQEKAYTCEFCGKSFTLKTTLTYHRHSHTNAKPYHCETCSKGFNSHSNLMIHRRRHVGDRRYPCSVCEMKFYNRYSLKRHALTHTDIRPLACFQCGKTYRNPTNLKYHIKKAHQIG